MKPTSVALVSVLANLILTLAKVGVGMVTHSLALTAEGLHSAVDIVSSVATFLGIRAAARPADTEHPFGHERYESASSMVVVLLLALSGLWILYEALASMVTAHGKAQFTILGLVVMGVSAVVNEVLARVKFHTAVRNDSLALTADAEHSRADAVASLAVFVGLAAVRYLPLADSWLAALVAAYILFEVAKLSKETLGSLLDTADPDLESRISALLVKSGHELEEITTRQAGKARFARVVVSYDPQATLEEVTRRAEQLKQELMSSFPELKQVTVNIVSHGYRESSIDRGAGRGFRYRQSGATPVVPPKQGLRVAIPVQNGAIAPGLGAREFLVMDFADDSSVISRSLVQNPYRDAGAAHGVRFLKSIQVDRVAVKRLGDGARKNLVAQGIAVETVSSGASLEEVVAQQARGGDDRRTG